MPGSQGSTGGPPPSDYRQYMGIGWVLAVSVGAGTALGVWADRRFGTSPWLTLTGLFLGMTAGFVNVFRIVFQDPKR